LIILLIIYFQIYKFLDPTLYEWINKYSNNKEYTHFSLINLKRRQINRTINLNKKITDKSIEYICQTLKNNPIANLKIKK
jgi:hypothetical protein